MRSLIEFLFIIEIDVQHALERLEKKVRGIDPNDHDEIVEDMDSPSVDSNNRGGYRDGRPSY